MAREYATQNNPPFLEKRSLTCSVSITPSLANWLGQWAREGFVDMDTVIFSFLSRAQWRDESPWPPGWHPLFKEER